MAINKSAYYNEHDPFAAAWLRELIKANLIAPGEVDERSIKDVRPYDLRGFRQCHFFAGIGVWSYTLRAAGWPDDLAVWTGSCPCQSFSQSGKGEGFSDKRHLWPLWFRLIGECAPDTIFGEQVSGANGLAWWDVVSSELEGIGYSCGALSTSAASVGAPHVRKRLYFVADYNSSRCEFKRTIRIHEDRQSRNDAVGCSENGIVADSAGRRREQRHESERSIQFFDANGELGNARFNEDNESGIEGSTKQGSNVSFWHEVEWIYCKDGKYRPVKPGLPVLVNGSTSRVGKLRGFGNALCAPQAQAFIESYMEISR